jgi:nucleotide-binding universal stress UspA family protein
MEGCVILSKLKVLVPLDGSEKSMHSLNWLKKFFSKEDLEITLIYVTEVFYTGDLNPAKTLLENAEFKSKQILDNAAKELEGYTVNKLNFAGHISDLILKEAKDGNYDMIVMTKSSVKGISRIIGSVTSKVVRNSEVAVIVVPD